MKGKIIVNVLHYVYVAVADASGCCNELMVFDTRQVCRLSTLTLPSAPVDMKLNGYEQLIVLCEQHVVVFSIRHAHQPCNVAEIVL